MSTELGVVLLVHILSSYVHVSRVLTVLLTSTGLVGCKSSNYVKVTFIVYLAAVFSIYI